MYRIFRLSPLNRVREGRSDQSISRSFILFIIIIFIATVFSLPLRATPPRVMDLSRVRSYSLSIYLFTLSNLMTLQLLNAPNPILREIRLGRLHRRNEFSIPTYPWITICSTELDICII